MDTRYIVRKDKVVLCRPDKPGECVQWLSETDTIEGSIMDFVTHLGALRASEMHGGVVVQQMRVPEPGPEIAHDW